MENLAKVIERIKIVLRDMNINEHDIECCKTYNDYEDMGFYQCLKSDLEKELKEEITKLIEVYENECK